MVCVFLIIFVFVFDFAWSLHYCGSQGPVLLPKTQISGFRLEKVMVFARHGARITAVASSLLPFLSQANNGVVTWNCSTLCDEISDSTKELFLLVRKRYVFGRNLIPGNCALGQLTAMGALQHFHLGAALRQTYNLSSFSSSSVYVRSTDTERTLLSARHILAAAFPDANSVNVETMDPIMDNAFPNPTLCPKLGTLMDNVTSSAPYLEYFHSKLGKILAKYSQLWNHTLTVDDVLYLNDELRSRICAGLSLPEGMTLIDAESILATVSQLTNMQYAPYDILQLSISGFLSDLRTIYNDNNHSFAVFAIHDATLRSLLLAVQDYDGHWPAFASHLLLEKWVNSSNQTVVTLSFDGQPLQMSAPCKAKICAEADFLQLLSQYIVPESDCAE